MKQSGEGALRGKRIDATIIEEVRSHLETTIKDLRHLRLEKVSQYVSEIKGRPTLRMAVDVTLTGYAPSLHAATSSFRVPMASIETLGVANAVDGEMQKQLTMQEARRRLGLATFGREVTPLRRDRIGHLLMDSLNIDLLVEIESGPEAAVRRIARGVDTIIARREADNHKAMPPYSLQGLIYDETIVLDDAILRHTAIHVSEAKMPKQLAIGERIGDHMDVPAIIGEARVKRLRDETRNDQPWGAGCFVVATDIETKQVQIRPYLKDRYGYEIPDDESPATPTPSFAGARGEAVELAVAVMEWWNGDRNAKIEHSPHFVDVARRILSR